MVLEELAESAAAQDIQWSRVACRIERVCGDELECVPHSRTFGKASAGSERFGVQIDTDEAGGEDGSVAGERCSGFDQIPGEAAGNTEDGDLAAHPFGDPGDQTLHLVTDEPVPQTKGTGGREVEEQRIQGRPDEVPPARLPPVHVIGEAPAS